MPDIEQPEAQLTPDQIAQEYHANLDANYHDYANGVMDDYQNGLGQKPVSDERVIRDYHRDLGMQKQYTLPEDAPADLREELEAYPQQTLVQWVINAAKAKVPMIRLYFEREKLLNEVDAIVNWDEREAARARLAAVISEILIKEREQDYS